MFDWHPSTHLWVILCTDRHTHTHTDDHNTCSTSAHRCAQVIKQGTIGQQLWASVIAVTEQHERQVVKFVELHYVSWVCHSWTTVMSVVVARCCPRTVWSNPHRSCQLWGRLGSVSSERHSVVSYTCSLSWGLLRHLTFYKYVMAEALITLGLSLYDV